MITTDHLTRVNNDVNGNPRYVFHYLDTGVSDYDLAVKEAKKILSCRKYNNKGYGGGIVFTSYNTQHDVDLINNLVAGRDVIKYLDEVISDETEGLDNYEAIIADAVRVYGHDRSLTLVSKVEQWLRGLPLGVKYDTYNIAFNMRFWGFEGEDYDLDCRYWKLLAWVIVNYRHFK